MEKNKLEKKYADTRKGDVCYFINNCQNGRFPVIFLHGLSSNHTTWIEIMETLGKENIKSLAPDMRGHGFSDKTRRRNLYKMPVFADDLTRIIEKEKIGDCIILGYSFSGAVALEYTRKFPNKVKGIILISANHTNPLKHKFYGWITPFLSLLLDIFGWLLVWQKRKKYHYFEQGNSEGYWNSTLKGFGTMPLSINYWMLSEMGRIDYGPYLEKIKCPVLIIRSIHDPFFSQKEMEVMAEKISCCETATIDETSHFLATAHQGKIKDLIINFIRKIV
jgi:pimeloyl-ACP methyl ester carboxylesterase